MLKVCGVTYTFTSNYGSCFQAYALQTAIEQMQVFGEKPQYMLLPIGKCPGYPKSSGGGIKPFLKRLVSSHTRKQFVDFENKYMKYAPVFPVDSFYKLNEMADAFVCGSDVIWNPKYNHGLGAFYLDFAKKYAFSYAASFGQAEIDTVKNKKISDLISRLDAVSVRENKGAEIAKLCTDKKVEVVVDPVLLLDSKAWNKVADASNPEGKYIFVYSVNTTKTLKNFVKRLKQQTGLKVIYSGGNAGAVMKLKMTQVHTPQKWLQLIRDAEYVITDSFHGVVFATLFHKTLFSIVEGRADEGFNVRMSDFLKRVGLENRIYSTVPQKIDLSGFDSARVDMLLDRMVSDSKAYLQKNLEAAYHRKMKCAGTGT